MAPSESADYALTGGGIRLMTLAGDRRRSMNHMARVAAVREYLVMENMSSKCKRQPECLASIQGDRRASRRDANREGAADRPGDDVLQVLVANDHARLPAEGQPARGRTFWTSGAQETQRVESRPGCVRTEFVETWTWKDIPATASISTGCASVFFAMACVRQCPRREGLR